MLKFMWSVSLVDAILGCGNAITSAPILLNSTILSHSSESVTSSELSLPICSVPI